MNAGNFSIIKKQLLFSKNLRHALLRELHSIPPSVAVATCGSLGCTPGESPPEGEAAAWGLQPCFHCSSEVSQVFLCLGILFQHRPKPLQLQNRFLRQEMEDKLDNECHGAMYWSTLEAFCIDP